MTLPAPYYQGVPMLVTVEGELFETGPLITDCPRHGGIFLFIDCVTRVNEEKNATMTWAARYK